jgi:O-succinylbenzoate synthase
MGLNHLGRIDSLRNKIIDLNVSINNAWHLTMPKVAIGVSCAMSKIQKWCLSYDWEYDFNK